MTVEMDISFNTTFCNVSNAMTLVTTVMVQGITNVLPVQMVTLWKMEFAKHNA